MRILEATIRQYRVHENLALTFDPGLTLVGGPNECGKSTLAEALHRALFLRARTTGQKRESMLSRTGTGHPEVELVFEARGRVYTLFKRFSGQSWRTTLTAHGGVVLEGEAAENELAALLGGDQPKLSEIDGHWSHVWVWQGQSWNDPAVTARDRHGDLVRRLQAAGGGAMLQSDRDERVVSLMAQRHDEIFTKSGAFRQGSPVRKAQEAAVAAKTRVDELEGKVRSRQQDAESLERLTADMTRREIDLARLEADQSQAEADLRRAAELEGRRRELNAAALAAEAEFNRVQTAEAEIRSLSERIEFLEAETGPAETGLDALRIERAQGRERIRAVEARLERTARVAERVRLTRDLARAQVRRAELRSARDRSVARLENVEAREKDLAGLKERLAGLARIGLEDLRRLRALEEARREAQGALGVRSTGVRLVRSDRPVLVDGRQAVVGQEITIQAEARILVGEGTEFSILPGGLQDLELARERARKTGNELERALIEFGATTLAEAEELSEARRSAEEAVTTAVAVLAALDPDGTRRRLEADSSALIEAESETVRLEERLGCRMREISGDQRLKGLDKTSEALTARLAAREAGLKDLRRDVDDLDRRMTEASEALDQGRRALDEARARRSVLVRQWGDDQIRSSALKQAAGSLELARAGVADVIRQLEELGADELQARQERLARAVKHLGELLNTAGTERAIILDRLRLDGSVDSVGELRKARERLEVAREELLSRERSARAVKLVHDLLSQERKTLADRFSRPLAERITRYLSRVFGPQARAVVRLDESGIQTIELVNGRGEGAMPFESLSMGAREQVSAAVRLAMAELLAQDHDGSLPVIFDDAFAYSDPDRIGRLQSMLDLAARSGLQVIVLSCNPSDYVALGALTVDLSHLGRPDTGEGAPADSESAVDAQLDMDGLGAEFRKVLAEAGGKSGNLALRRTLGWDEDVYETVRRALLAEGIVETGSGRGGSVVLADDQTI